jgi:hypothetical protein
VAPTIAPPLGSVRTPVIVADDVWAFATGIKASDANIARTSNLSFVIFVFKNPLLLPFDFDTTRKTTCETNHLTIRLLSETILQRTPHVKEKRKIIIA